jgi:hypothetical protein
MGRGYFLGIMVIGWGLFLSLSGCAHPQNQGPASPETYGVEKKSGKYSKEISKHEATARSDSDASKRMRAHFQLAHLYTSYKNPKRNYKKALEHLEIYASLQPDFTDNQDLRDWLLALKELDRQSKKLESQNQKIKQLTTKLDQSQLENSTLKKAKIRLKKENTKFKKTNAQLTESNETLAKTIEMLKNIDRHIEEKRKNYSNH